MASVHPDDRDRVQRVMDQSSSDGRPFDVEYRILSAGGQSAMGSLPWAAPFHVHR